MESAERENIATEIASGDRIGRRQTASRRGNTGASACDRDPRKRRFLVGREITWGARIPRGWSMAWYEPRRRVAVYFPAPLHWMARLARELGWRLQVAWNALPQERHESCEMQRVFCERQRIAEEYARGYLDGWEECFDAWTRAMNCDPDDWNGREN
jgi:hypothetical protein